MAVKEKAVETKRKTSKKTAPKKPAINERPALITGFPGFLASRLLDELVETQPRGQFTLLIQTKMRQAAQKKIEDLRRNHPKFNGELELVEGDISAPRLGLSESRYAELQERIGVVWHLAAIYDLAVPEELAYRVNVGGTVQIVDFCAGLEHPRLNYVSTCYVAGKRQGYIREDELDEGQAHNNHYESTKFWAEMEVHRRMSEVPSAIFRPTIVVGDSRTGKTDKYDGPYYLLKVIKRLPSWAPFPRIGKGDTFVNIVPVDFVAKAMVHIGLTEGTDGTVYQLADPHPMRARDIVALGLKCMDRARTRGVIPPKLLDAALSLEGMEKRFGLPRQVVEYFTHDARYDTTNTSKALQDSDVRCPHLSAYMQVLVDYFEQFPEKEFLDGRAV